MRSIFGWSARLLGVASLTSFLGVAAMQAATLGTTTVDLNTGTVVALVSAGLTPGAVAPGTLAGGPPFVATFPITSLDTTGTMISHSGGLSFTQGTTTVDIENFLINLNTDKLTGDVYAGSSLVASGLTFFDIGAGNALTLDASLASAVNSTFGTSLSAGIPIGTASVSLTSATPEPASMALLGTGGLLCLLSLRRRRSTQS